MKLKKRLEITQITSQEVWEYGGTILTQSLFQLQFIVICSDCPLWLRYQKDDSGSCGWLGIPGQYIEVLAITWLIAPSSSAQIKEIGQEKYWGQMALSAIHQLCREQKATAVCFIQIYPILEYFFVVLSNIYQIPFHKFRMTFWIDYGYCNTTALHFKKMIKYNLFKGS